MAQPPKTLPEKGAGWQSVPCPVCHAQVGQSCVYVLFGMEGQRRTTEHAAREAAYEKARKDGAA